jgi:hypothetical protein
MELIQTGGLKSCKDFGNQRCKTLLAYEPGTDLGEQISPIKKILSIFVKVENQVGNMGKR